MGGLERGREGYWHYLCLGLSLHDHDLPRKVADNARLGEDRVSDLGEIINFELECGLTAGLVILFTDDIFISLDLRLSRVAGGVGLGLVHVLLVHHLLHGAQRGGGGAAPPGVADGVRLTKLRPAADDTNRPAVMTGGLGLVWVPSLHFMLTNEFLAV